MSSHEKTLAVPWTRPRAGRAGAVASRLSPARAAAAGGRHGPRHAAAALFWAAAVSLAPLVACAAEGPQAEVEHLLRRLERRLDELREPTRSAIEDYLDDRGITGLAWTDDDLRPLDRVLRRATLGAEIRLRYQRLDNFYDLDDETGEDVVDYSEIRARLAFGCALAGGAELELELQGLLPATGLLDRPAFPSVMTPEVLGPEGLFAGSDSFTVRRAEVRLPSVNLLGRLVRLPVTAVLGRQEIALGTGFVMGRLDEEAGLTYDGARVFFESGAGTRADAFWGRAGVGAGEIVARAGGYPAVRERNADYPEVEIAGVRCQGRGLLQDTTLAAYLLTARLGRVPALSTYPELAATEVNTFGVEGSVDVTASSVLRFEAASQWGDRGDMSVERAAAGEVSFEWRGRPLGATGYVAFATGDRPHTDGVYEGFIPLAQDTRGRWEELGLLASSNCLLWGIRGRYGDPRGAHATLSVTQAFADDPASRAGAFVYDPPQEGGKEMGLFISASAEGRIFGEEDSRARVSLSSFLPGRYFSGARDPATFLSFEMRLGF